MKRQSKELKKEKTRRGWEKFKSGVGKFWGKIKGAFNKTKEFINAF